MGSDTRTAAWLLDWLTFLAHWAFFFGVGWEGELDQRFEWHLELQRIARGAVDDRGCRNNFSALRLQQLDNFLGQNRQWSVRLR